MLLRLVISSVSDVVISSVVELSRSWYSSDWTVELRKVVMAER